MNRLSTGQRAEIIRALVEGNSIRATCRMTGAAKWTVVRLLVALGHAAMDYQDAVLRDLPCKRVQADEIWSFIGAKEKNVMSSPQRRGTAHPSASPQSATRSGDTTPAFQRRTSSART